MTSDLQQPDRARECIDATPRAREAGADAKDHTQKPSATGPGNLTILHGDALAMLQTIESESVQCVVTSPPYWQLRDYKVEGQIGREYSLAEYLAKLVAVFSEVRRVLKDDGVAWVNMGDTYASAWPCSRVNQIGNGSLENGKREARPSRLPIGLKEKDLILLPSRLALALQESGWWLRSEITWCKRAPMPESVTDRPTNATEKIFLLTKSEDYFYNSEAVRTPPSDAMVRQVSEGYNGEALKGFESNGVQNASSVKSRIIGNARKKVDRQRGHTRPHNGFNGRWDGLTRDEQMAFGSNMRNYWMLGPDPLLDNHFAAFPREIPRRCILAGSRPGDIVLDPFAGSGTTGMVALELGRRATLIELNADYIELIKQRTNITPGFQFK